MSAFWGQLVFLAKNNDPGGWMQILVFVAMIAVYSLSGILKAKGDKKKKLKEGKGEEKAQQPRSAGPVPRPQSRRGEGPAQRRKMTRPPPAVRKPSAKAGQPAWVPVARPPAEPELSMPRPQVQPGISEASIITEKQKRPEFTSDTIRALKGKEDRPAVSAKTSVPKHLTKLLLDVSAPGEIRRAILHYEILGKPLSLRGPGEQIIGL